MEHMSDFSSHLSSVLYALVPFDCGAVGKLVSLMQDDHQNFSPLSLSWLFSVRSKINKSKGEDEEAGQGRLSVRQRACIEYTKRL